MRSFKMILILSTSVFFSGTISATQDELPHIENELPDVYDLQSSKEIEHANAQIAKDFAGAVDPETLPESVREKNLRLFDHLDSQHLVPTRLLKTTVEYFAANKNRFPNQNYITVVDFAPHSAKYRFFLINTQTGAVERYHTTHGRGGDLDNDGYAESFGNIVDSHKSSLGFVRVAEVYSGKYKKSLRLDGLSETNSRVRERAIVFHGWDGAKEANVKQGRSRGCITLDWKVKDGVLNKIKEGSLMYVGLSTQE